MTTAQVPGNPFNYYPPANLPPKHESSHTKLVLGSVLAAGAVALAGTGAVAYEMHRTNTILEDATDDQYHSNPNSPNIRPVEEAPDPASTPNYNFQTYDADAQVRALAALVNKQIEAKGKEYTDKLSNVSVFGVDGRIKPAEATDSPSDALAHVSAVSYLYLNETDPELRQNLVAMNYLPGTSLYNQELRTVENPQSNIPSSYKVFQHTSVVTEGNISGVEANGMPTFGAIVSDRQHGDISSTVVQLRGDNPSTPEVEPSSWVVVQAIDPGDPGYVDIPVVLPSRQQ